MPLTPDYENAATIDVSTNSTVKIGEAGQMGGIASQMGGVSQMGGTPGSLYVRGQISGVPGQMNGGNWMTGFSLMV